MSNTIRKAFKSGGLIWDPLNQLWQLDGKDRAFRDPTIPTAPLESPVPFFNSCCAVAFVPQAVEISSYAYPNVVITASVVVAPAPFQQTDWTSLRDPKELNVVTAQANLLVTTLAVEAAPFVPALHAAAIRYQWLSDDTTLGTAKPLVADGIPAFIPQPHAPPAFYLDKNQDTSLGMTVQLFAAPFVSVVTWSAIQRPNEAAVFVYPNLATQIVVALPIAFSGSAPVFISPSARRDVAPSLVDIPPNLVLRHDVAVYAGEGAIRGPTFTQRHSARQVIATQQHNVTIGTLSTVIIPPPIVPVLHFSPLTTRWQPADSSRSSAKVLIADATPAFVPILHAAPLRRWWQPPDGSTSTPKGLLFDAQLPSVCETTGFAAQRRYKLADTSAGSPATLLDVVVANPFVPQSHTLPTQQRLYADDTSAGTPKPLIADAQAPVFVAPVFAPSAKPLAGWLPSDTTAKQPITLQAIVPPVVVTPHFGPLRQWFQPADATHGTPKTLITDAQAPVFVLQQSLAPRLWFQPADSTRSTPKTLIPDAQAPVFVLQQSLIPRQWFQPLDSTRGTPRTISDAQAPLFVLQQSLAPRQWFEPVDTTRGTPKTLTADAQPPLFDAAPFNQIQHRPTELVNANTSAGTPKPLIADAQAPFNVNWMLPPVIRRQFNNTSLSTSPALIDAAAAAPFVPVLHAAPIRTKWLPADGSRSTPKPIIDATATFVPVLHAAPIKRQWQPLDSSRSSAKPLLEDQQLPLHADTWLAPQLQRVRQVVATQFVNLLVTTLAEANPFVPTLPLPVSKRAWQPLDASSGSAKVLLAFQPAWAAAANVLISSGARVT